MPQLRQLNGRCIALDVFLCVGSFISFELSAILTLLSFTVIATRLREYSSRIFRL